MNHLSLFSGMETLPTPLEIRERILQFESALSQVPGAVFGDTPLCPLTHKFGDGVYVREIRIPAGTVLTGKIHKHAHPNFLMAGEVLVVTESEGVQHLKAPLSMISPPGTKRALIAVTDVWWITVHVTDKTDLVQIESSVIASDYTIKEALR